MKDKYIYLIVVFIWLIAVAYSVLDNDIVVIIRNIILGILLVIIKPERNKNGRRK